jgi:hypothetical protein
MDDNKITSEEDVKRTNWSYEERCKAQELRMQGWTCEEIGKEIGRSKGAVVRMVKGIPQGVRKEPEQKLSDPPMEDVETCPGEPIDDPVDEWKDDKIKLLEGSLAFLYELLEEIDKWAKMYKYNYDVYRESVKRTVKRRKKLGIKVEGKWPDKQFDLTNLKLPNGKAHDDDGK